MFKPRRVDEHHTESFLKPLLATFQSRSPCFLFSIFWIFKLGLSESSVYTQKSSPFNRKGPFGGIRKKHHFQTRHLWILIHIQADADISATLQQSVRARREVNGSRHSISLSGWLWQNSSRNWVAFIVTLYAHVTWDFSTGNLFGWKPCRLLRPPIFVPDSIAQSIHLLPYPQAICCGKFLVQGTIHWPESRRRRDSLDFIGASHLYVYIYICLDFVICLMLNWQSLINQCKYGIFRCRL